MKNLKYLLYPLIAFIVITGFFMNKFERIPDNAQIYLLESNKTWLPKADFTDKIIAEQMQDPILSEALIEAIKNAKTSTYYEVDKGSSSNYDLPGSWQDGKDRTLWGVKESALRSWILPKNKRWDKDGSWNW